MVDHVYWGLAVPSIILIYFINLLIMLKTLAPIDISLNDYMHF